jgi:hypothetical protein
MAYYDLDSKGIINEVVAEIMPPVKQADGIFYYKRNTYNPLHCQASGG